MINFSIVTTPCQGFQALGELPTETASDDFLVAYLLPELAFAELAVPLLDAGGSSAAAPSPAPRLDWRAPAPARYWRSPELRPGRAAANRPLWLAAAPPATQPLLVQDSTPGPDPGPWQPGALPAGSDPLPLPGVFGALPLEQQAGNCVIFGEVASGLEPVAKAFVDVIGTGRVAETDAQGRFRIEGLPAGDFTVEASALNYSPQVLGVSPNPTAPVELRFNLTVKPVESGTEEYTLDEESIVGEFNESSQGDFNLTLQAEAPVLTSAVNRDDFAKTAVSDAGEAIAKVSGANIVDGKYAVVRGLADRYVTTTFNGSQIASADPSRKAVQLDLFPTNVIEAINVDKTYSADLSGDFGGAAIDIVTRAFPTERIMSFKSKIEWNSALGDKMYVHPGRDLGFFGDTGNEMPDYLESRDPTTGEVVFLPTPTTTPDDLKARMTKLHQSQSLLPVQDEAEEGYSFGLTLGDTFTLPNGMKLGVITALAQSSGDETNSSEINNQDRSYFRDDYERGVELSAFISAALEMNELNRVQVTYFNKHDAKDVVSQGRRITGTNKGYGDLISSPVVRDAYGADAVYFREFWDVETVERDLQIFQAKGEHSVSEGGIRLNWSIAESDAAEKRPYSTHFEYGLLDFSEKILAPYVAAATVRLDGLAKENATASGVDPSTVTWENYLRPLFVNALGEEATIAFERDQGLPTVNGALGQKLTIYPIADLVGQAEQTITAFRRKDSTKEDASHRQMAVTVPYKLDKASDQRLVEIGIGGGSLRKTRDISARVYSLVTAETNGNFSFPGSVNGPGEELAEDPDDISDSLTGDITTGPYYGYGVGDGGVENINTVLTQNSLFLTGRFQWGDFFFSAGVRSEKEEYEIDVASSPLVPFTDEQVDALGWERRDSQEALLPSFISGTSMFDNKLDLVVAWSQTVARPTFWEFLPTTSVDQSTGITRRGNVGLNRTEITNFDISATLRPTDGLTLRSSLFHKNLDRPLVQVFSGDGIVYRDASFTPGQERDYTATISGIELEGELAGLGPFSLKGNFTYIDAQLNYFFESGGVVEPVTSQLPFQPSYIANATLGYEHEPWGFNANLVFNFNGKYPVILKESEDQSEVTRLSLATWDLVLSKKFETDLADCTIKCGVKNLLNAEDTFIYDDRTYSNETLGRSIFLETEISF